jgi:transcriptional regulator with XRE-family HTH domain
MIEEEKNLNRLRIGQRIAELRQEKGLTVRQLGEMSGVSYQNITKIEHGKYNVSIDILNKICLALGVELKIE